MIDTFALCGKSTWEKILLPKLFKQTMVKFSFLVTNLTFQGSDSSLAEREELMPAWGPWPTDSPRSHIHLEISWHCLSLCVLLGQLTGGAVAEAAEGNDPGHTLGTLCWFCCMAEVASDSFSLWFLPLVWAYLWCFSDKAAPEDQRCLTAWKWLSWGKEGVSHRIVIL